MIEDSVKDVRAFWNSRAGLGQWAGTRDVILKQLEIEAIASYVHEGMSILDVGCGNGITAIELARRFDVQVLGIDFAEEMIRAAETLASGQALRGSVYFEVNDARNLSPVLGKFDLIYTERTLINLSDWPSQRAAIHRITFLLKNGGSYVMCENSQDALNKINSFREEVGLPWIDPPWHNRYLRDTEVQQDVNPGIQLEHVNHFSSTYYFLSRIVNASLAQQEGKEPDYESYINQLALKLPPYGDTGQTKIWLWRRIIE